MSLVIIRATLARRWLAFLLLAFLMFPVRAFADTAVVSIEGESTVLEPGASARIAVSVSNVQDLYGFQINLQFDPAVFQINDSDPGKDGIQLRAGSFLSPDFVAENEVDNRAGMGRFAAVQLNPTEPKSGSGVLLELDIEALAPGLGGLTITSVDSSTRDGIAIGSLIENGEVRVKLASDTTSTTQPITDTPRSVPGAAQSSYTPGVTAGPSPVMLPDQTPTAPAAAQPPAISVVPQPVSADRGTSSESASIQTPTSSAPVEVPANRDAVAAADQPKVAAELASTPLSPTPTASVSPTPARLAAARDPASRACQRRARAAEASRYRVQRSPEPNAARRRNTLPCPGFSGRISAATGNATGGILVKLRLVLCALLLVVVSTPLVLADSTATALVRPDPIVVKTNVSRTFTVDIFVQDVANLYGADITFAFDPLQLEVVDAVPGVAGLQLAALDEFLYPDYVAKNKACNAVDQSDPDCAVAGRRPLCRAADQSSLACVWFWRFGAHHVSRTQARKFLDHCGDERPERSEWRANRSSCSKR